MSNIINSKVIGLKQNGVEIYITKMKATDLIKTTMVDVYESNKNPNGYQRPLNSTQVKNLCEYLQVEQYSILPTSIILAISKEKIKFIDNKQELIVEENLRIVDGQHRIAAMRQIINAYINDDNNKEELEEFKNREYPVNIMLLDKENPNERYIEIKSFVDINKKGKKVTTDLADINMQKVRKEFRELPLKEAYHQICLNVVNNLNEDRTSSWYNQIKLGDNNNLNKPIGISSFALSIMPIVKKYVNNQFRYEHVIKMKEIDSASTDITKIINKYWKFIGDRWPDAFYWEPENEAFRFDSDYNIQKTLGVASLHKVLNHCYETQVQKAEEDAELLLEKTNISEKQWIRGGEFSSFTSSSGHSKIADKIIKNAD